jgi:hypothetical protein
MGLVNERSRNGSASGRRFRICESRLCTVPVMVLLFVLDGGAAHIERAYPAGFFFLGRGLKKRDAHVHQSVQHSFRHLPHRQLRTFRVNSKTRERKGIEDSRPAA